MVHLRRWLQKRFNISQKPSEILALIETSEANEKFLVCVKLSQKMYFNTEFSELKKGHRSSKYSS